MAKELHPKIKELKDRTAGEFLTCRYLQPLPKPKKGIRAVETPKYKDDPRVIEGYLAVFGVKDSYGTVAVKGCFAKSIRDRGPESNAKNKIIHLFGHNQLDPVGSYVELSEDDYGLYFACRADDVAGTPERVLVQTRSGTLNQFSYGFEYIWDRMEYDEKDDAILMYDVYLEEGTSLGIRASNPETYAIRSKEELVVALADLGKEAEEVIESLPRNFRMEIRQLIMRYKSLAKFEPAKKLLDLKSEPIDRVKVGSYKLNLTEF